MEALRKMHGVVGRRGNTRKYPAFKLMDLICINVIQRLSWTQPMRSQPVQSQPVQSMYTLKLENPHFQT